MPRNLRRGPIPSDIGDLVDELDDIQERLRTLEAPGGEALYSTVKKLQRLVDDIQAQLDSYLATRYTNTQIDTFIAGRAPVSHTHDQSQVTGTWDKAVSTSSGIYAAGAITFPNVYATDLTGTRRTGWVQSDGRMGYASSAVEGKTAIVPATIDIDGVLDLVVREFYYRAEIRRRTNLRINEGVDYHPARELGLLAHEVDAVAPWLVYHDDAGHAEGVEYAMLPVALLAIAQAERQARLDLEARVTELERDAG